MPGCYPYRELDDAVGLTDAGADTLADARTGKNGRHRLAGLLRQSVFGRLAGYEDVNDADRLCRDPAIRWVVGDRAITGADASASQMGRFETEWLTRAEKLHTGIVGVQLAEEHGAEQRTPGQKENRNAIDHCFQATSVSSIIQFSLRRHQLNQTARSRQEGRYRERLQNDH
jgi:hypothetical protein